MCGEEGELRLEYPYHVECGDNPEDKSEVDNREESEKTNENVQRPLPAACFLLPARSARSAHVVHPLVGHIDAPLLC